MPLVPVDEPEPGSLEDLRVEIAPIVDDDAHPPAEDERRAGVLEDTRDAVDVLLDRSAAGAARGPSELEIVALVDTQELVRVAMLLVVVDQARDTAER